ncbi:MAG: hypothetical protein HPY66_0354 [Firmicutes bacterium]|nr:hypothetical protein [Bacillota bacterium]
MRTTGLKKTETKKNFWRTKNIYAAASILLIVTLLISFCTTTSADNALFQSVWFRAQKNIGSIFKLNTEHKINSNDIIQGDEDSNIDELHTTDIGEAEKITDGIIALPEYIPDGFALKGISIYKSGGKVHSILIEYDNTDGQILKLRESIILEGNTYSINYKEDNTDMTEFEDDGIKYVIMEFDNGTAKLVWDKYGINYMFTGRSKTAHRSMS